MTRFVAISDTHNMHDKLRLPQGDVLIHAGDFTTNGSLKQFSSFANWINQLDYKHIIVVPGNHDFLAEHDWALAKSLFTKAKLIHDQQIEIDGKKIYGSAWTPEFNGWAFATHGSVDAKEKWGRIPEDTNILITHGPPEGILDAVPVINHYDGTLKYNRYAGCPQLLKRVGSLSLSHHVFGHIHEQHGFINEGGKTFINASMLDGSYRLTKERRPIVFSL